MAKANVDLPTLDDNLFLPVPVVLLAELVSETAELGLAYPEILHGQDEGSRISRFEQDGAQLPDRKVEIPSAEQVRFGPDGIGLWHWQGTTNLVMRVLHATVAASGVVEQLRLPAPAICTAVSAPFSVYRVAIAADQGIHLYWPERGPTLGEPLRLTYDFVPHCMLFLANGMLVAADEKEVRVFRTKSHKAEPLLRLPNGAAPVALSRGPKISDLAVLRADGSIGVYTLA